MADVGYLQIKIRELNDEICIFNNKIENIQYEVNNKQKEYKQLINDAFEIINNNSKQIIQKTVEDNFKSEFNKLLKHNSNEFENAHKILKNETNKFIDVINTITTNQIDVINKEHEKYKREIIELKIDFNFLLSLIIAHNNNIKEKDLPIIYDDFKTISRERIKNMVNDSYGLHVIPFKDT